MMNTLKMFNNMFRVTGTLLSGKLLFIILLSVLSSVLIIISPLLISRMTGYLMGGEVDVSGILFILGGIYVFAISAQKIMAFWGTYLQAALRVECIAIISEFYLRKLYNGHSQKDNAGGISQQLSQATNDIYIIIRELTFGLLPPLVQLFIAVWTILSSGDYPVAGMFLLFAVSFIFCNYIYTNKIVMARQALMDSSRKTYSLLSDSVRNIPVVRVFNGFDIFMKRFRTQLTDDASTQNTFWKISFQSQFISGLLQIIFFGSAFFYTLNGAIDGRVSTEHFILVSAYILILSAPLENLGQSFINFRQAAWAFTVFSGELLPHPENNNKKTCKPQNGTTELSQVSLRYPDATSDTLRDITVRFRSGEFVTITGSSGAGKSTLLKILARQLQPTTGKYTVGECDISALPEQEFYENVAYVSQEEYVFMDSIAYNLQIANPQATRAEMISALEKSGLQIGNLRGEKLLELDLTNEGANISGGQRQRLSLARLFLRNPAVILLDEITSSLDLISETQVINAIISSFPEATIISISHRLSTFSYSDRIVVMENGCITDTGSMDELSIRNGFIMNILHAGAGSTSG
ncbi:ATP-binding cassette domain-containing protein [Enterobacter ludwigii]|nr:ATP-binding cassette domain-containing protein [Enterobacter ludwigii]